MSSTPPQNAEEIPEGLVLATEVLANRVKGLADVVAINNVKIDRLQDEVNHKPDDIEVKTLTQIGNKERKLIRDRTLVTCIVFSFIAACLSGGVAFWVAETSGHDRCARNQRSFDIIIAYLDTIPNPEPYLKETAMRLRQNRNPC